MYTATVQNLAKGALKDLGVLALGHEMTGPEGADMLELFNQLVDALGVDRGLLYAIVRTTKTLANGTASYTIGSGGDIDLVRPLWIAGAGLVLDTGAATPLEAEIDVLTVEQYQAWPQKTEQSSLPRAIWYDYGAASGLGTVYPLPIPNVGTTQLVLYTPGGHIAQITDITTEFAVPPGYAWFLRRLLAEAAIPMFPTAAPTSIALVQQSAAAIRRQIKAANTRPVYREPSADFPAQRGQWDMNTGTFR